MCLLCSAILRKTTNFIRQTRRREVEGRMQFVQIVRLYEYLHRLISELYTRKCGGGEAQFFVSIIKDKFIMLGLEPETFNLIKYYINLL